MIVNAPVSGSYKINFRGKGDGLTIDAGDNIYEMTLNREKIKFQIFNLVKAGMKYS